MLMPSLSAAKIIAILGALLAVFAAGAGSGAYVATLKAEAGFSGERQTCSADKAGQAQQISDLRIATTEQNGKIALLKAETTAANDAKVAAQAFAAQQAAFSKSRMDKLQDSLNETCGDVLKNYWELRK